MSDEEIDFIDNGDASEVVLGEENQSVENGELISR